MNVQSWQLKTQKALDEIGAVLGEKYDNLTTLLNDKFILPLGASLSGSVLTINASTIQKLTSDGSDSTENGYKWRIPTLSNLDVQISQSTIDLSNGDTTGDFADNPVLSPGVSGNSYIQLGIEARTDSKLYAIWGDQATTVSGTTVPPFSSGSLQVLVAVLQNSGVGGSWNFSTPARSDIELIVKGSSGSGAGNADAIWEDMKDWQEELGVEFLEGNIFSIDASDKVSGATATYDFAEQAYVFGVGDYVLSNNMAGAEFLESALDLVSVDLRMVYDLGNFDSNPTVEVSRNGGVSYQTMTLARVGTTDTYVSRVVFDAEAVNQLIEEYALTNSTTAISLNNGAYSSVAQRIVMSETQKIKKVRFKMQLGASLTAGILYTSIYDNDGSNNPNNELTRLQALDLSAYTPGSTVTVELDASLVVESGQSYHLVWQTDDVYKANYGAGKTISIEADSTSPPLPGLGYADGAGVWSVLTTHKFVYELEGRVIDLRVKITGGTADASLKGLALAYGDYIKKTGALKKIESFTVNTGDASVVLTVNKFAPDQDLVQVYVPELGQVFKASPSTFVVDGRNLTFVDNFFYSLPARDILVLVDQHNGGVYDLSDTNSGLLAANHLGSTDSNLDKSSPGRGIMLKSPNGTLYEIAVKDGGSGFDIYEVTV